MGNIKTSHAGKSFLLTLTGLFCVNPLYAVEKQAATQAELDAALGQADTTSIRLTGDIARTTNPPVMVSTTPLGIEGDGHTLDGNSSRRLFNVRGPGSNVSRDLDFVRNTRFINGSYSMDGPLNPANWGGAIRVTGNVVNGMQDVQFVDNFSVGNGGAVVVINGNFSGGITATPGATMPTFFRGNKSGQSGSAVFMSGDFSGGLTGVEFSDNEAARSGTFYVGNFLGDITNVTFDNNRSTWTNPGYGTSFGGAGFVAMKNVGSDSAPTIIRDSTFINHQAIVGVQGTSLSGGGGAFSVAAINQGGSRALGNFTGSIINSLFRDNTVTGTPNPSIPNGSVFGGGLFVRFIFKGNIEDSQFLDNKVVKTASLQTGGGAVALGDLDGSILGSDSTATIFRGNSADRGGAIQVLSQITGSISGTAANPVLFEDNHAESGQGGAILAGAILGGIHYGKFSDNSATDFGGAIRITSGGGISGGIDGGTVFENNQAGGGGGALSVINNIGSRQDGVAIDDVTFRDNTAQTFGGAIHVGQSILGKIQNATFTSNQAAQGGAIHTRGLAGADTGISEIASSNFENNTAGVEGGAIWSRKLSGNLTDSVSFSNNKALAGSGGAIYIENHAGGNIASQFEANTADHGGAIYAKEVNGGVISGRFSDNRALAKGGAVYYRPILSGGSIQNAQFYNNKAQQAGGALYVEPADQANSAGAMNVSNSLFIGNSAQATSSVTQASGLGGAIAAGGNSGSARLSINNSIFLRNRAETQDASDTAGGFGGAVFFEGLTTNSPTLAIRASGIDGKTLFYGNTQSNASQESYNAIHIGHLRDAGQNGTVNLRIETNDTAGDVLMLDPISSQADNLAKPGGGNYGKVSVVVTKTGVGNWFLGGQSQMRSSFANWFIREGALHLVTVDYGSGAVDTQINLLGNDSAAFFLEQDGSLAGSGSIAARNIALRGYLAPNTQVNTGVKAAALDPNGTITQADIDSIDVEESSTYGKLTFDTQGSGSAVTMDGAVYEVDLAWDNAGAPINDLIDIKGALDVKKSTIDVRGLSFETAPVSTPDNDTQWDFYQPATVIKTTDGITGDFQLAVGGAPWVSVDYLRGLIGEKSNAGKDYDLRLGLSWYAPLAASNPIPRSGNDLEDPAHGTFTLTDAANTFTVDGELKNREGASESGWNGRDLTKAGAGTLILNGVNTYSGETVVQAGSLVLGDTQFRSTAQIAGNVTVANNAVFSGYGSVLGNGRISSGATLAPGGNNTIGTTMTFGALTFDAGSIYRVKAHDDGAADRVNVTQDLTVHGGVVDVQARAGAWSVDRSYTILAYGGARAGSFDGVTSNFAFLTPVLDYDTDNQVILRLARNNASSPCVSANQCSVEDAIPPGSPVDNAIVSASEDEAREAYDSLSGEIYASTRAAILGNRYLRDAMRRRMLTSEPSADDRLWLHTWGQSGHIAGDANAAKADISGIGLALGADMRVNDNTRAGVVFGYEDGKVKNGNLRNSRASIDAYSLGAYVATQFDSMALRAGVAYSYLDIDTKRDIRAGTLAGQVKSDSKGQKVQAFVEAGRDFKLGDSTVSPYVGVAQVWLRTRGAAESGNAAALDVRGRTDSITQTTLGVRGAVPLSAQVSLTADLGWVHAFGDVQGKADNRFATGNRFAVRGVGVDKNMALVGVGVQAQPALNTALSLGYQGQLGSRTKDHSVQLQVRMRF